MQGNTSFEKIIKNHSRNYDKTRQQEKAEAKHRKQRRAEKREVV